MADLTETQDAPSKGRILLYSDSARLHTGFARVIRTLGNHLVAQGYAVRQAAVTDAVPDAADPLEFPVYGADPRQDYWGRTVLAEQLRTWRPDVLFSLLDDWMLVEPGMDGEPYKGLPLLPERRNVVWVKYAPYDGEPMPPAWIPINYDADVLIAMADYGAQILRHHHPGKPVYRIYHGVDTQVFRPFDPEARKALRRKYQIPEQAFVITRVDRNQPRKNIPALLEAVARFIHRGKHRVPIVLVLRMSNQDVGGSLVDLLDRYGLRRHTLLFDTLPVRGVPEQTLAEIYNLGDLFVSTSLSEGFGFGPVESRACGVPALVPNFSAMPELASGPAEIVPLATKLVSARHIEQGIVHVGECVRAIQRFYEDPRLREHYGRLGRERAERLDWRVILPQFEAVIAEAVAEAQRRQADPRPVLPLGVPIHALRPLTDAWASSVAR